MDVVGSLSEGDLATNSNLDGAHAGISSSPLQIRAAGGRIRNASQHNVGRYRRVSHHNLKRGTELRGGRIPVRPTLFSVISIW